jgi:hypothetical protein
MDAVPFGRMAIVVVGLVVLLFVGLAVVVAVWYSTRVRSEGRLVRRVAELEQAVRRLEDERDDKRTGTRPGRPTEVHE